MARASTGGGSGKTRVGRSKKVKRVTLTDTQRRAQEVLGPQSSAARSGIVAAGPYNQNAKKRGDVSYSPKARDRRAAARKAAMTRRAKGK